MLTCRVLKVIAEAREAAAEELKEAMDQTGVQPTSGAATVIEQVVANRNVQVAVEEMARENEEAEEEYIKAQEAEKAKTAPFSGPPISPHAYCNFSQQLWLKPIVFLEFISPMSLQTGLNLAFLGGALAMAL